EYATHTYSFRRPVSVARNGGAAGRAAAERARARNPPASSRKPWSPSASAVGVRRRIAGSSSGQRRRRVSTQPGRSGRTAVRGKPAVHRLQHRGDLGDDPSDLREREELALLEALLDRAPQRQTLDELHRVEGIDAGRLGVEDADETGSREPLRLETSRLED